MVNTHTTKGTYRMRQCCQLPPLMSTGKRKNFIKVQLGLKAGELLGIQTYGEITLLKLLRQLPPLPRLLPKPQNNYSTRLTAQGTTFHY